MTTGIAMLPAHYTMLHDEARRRGVTVSALAREILQDWARSNVESVSHAE